MKSRDTETSSQVVVIRRFNMKSEFDSILMIIDRLTKYIMFAKRNCNITLSIHIVLLKELISNRTIKRVYHQQRQAVYKQSFEKHFTAELKLKHKMSTAYHFRQMSKLKDELNDENIFVSLCQQKSEQLNMTIVYSTFVQHEMKS